MGGSILIAPSSNDGVLSLNVEIAMTKAKKLRKFWVREGKAFDLDISNKKFFPPLKGSKYFQAIEAAPLLEELRAVRDELTSNHDNYDAIVKLDALIKEIENE